MSVWVCHVARSRARLRTRCGRLAANLVCIDVEIASDPAFWLEGTSLRAMIIGSAKPAVCVSCAAAKSERLDGD